MLTQAPQLTANQNVLICGTGDHTNMPCRGNQWDLHHSGQKRKNNCQVLYVPQATLWLISMGRLADEGIISSFSPDECTLHHGSKVMAHGKCTGKGLYII